MNRLFVPLAAGPFEDFRDHGKRAELRAYGRNFTSRTVFTGRAVELRKGYSLREGVPENEWRLWGQVGEVVVGSLGDVFEKFNYTGICPRTQNLDEAEKVIGSIIGEHSVYIAFEVSINR